VSFISLFHEMNNVRRHPGVQLPFHDFFFSGAYLLNMFIESACSRGRGNIYRALIHSRLLSKYLIRKIHRLYTSTLTLETKINNI
jgi:hypothetical protein